MHSEDLGEKREREALGYTKSRIGALENQVMSSSLTFFFLPLTDTYGEASQNEGGTFKVLSL